MVNTGKPSTGCHLCRSRRVKCDETKPHCLRCQRFKKTCPGYRDSIKPNTHDQIQSTKPRVVRIMKKHSPESNDAVGKSRTLYPKMAAETPPMFSSWGSGSSDRSSDDSHSSDAGWLSYFSMPQQLSPPLHEQAVCFFLTNFVLLPEHGTVGGYLEFLTPLFKTTKSSSPLYLAFSAVALAALGTRPASKPLLSKANMLHLKAVQGINSALKDPSLAKDDSILASVLLLALFEQLIGISQMDIEGWSSHVSGAVALIKSRGDKQFQSQVGRTMFSSVRSLMTIQCVANSKPIDIGVDWWMNQVPHDDVTYKFDYLNLKVAELRADTNATTNLSTRSPSNTEKVLKLLRRAEALDQQYLQWYKTLPRSWKPKTVSWVDLPEANISGSPTYPGRVDAYEYLGIAFKHNFARSCRLFIWNTILRCVAWLNEPEDYKVSPEYATASRISKYMVDDIIASVPFFLGWKRDADPTLGDKSQFACGDKTSIKILSGITMMWPLFAAMCSDFATVPQKAFLRRMLEYIGTSMGINQAQLLLSTNLSHPSNYIQRDRMNVPPRS